MGEKLDHRTGWMLRITDSGRTDRETVARVLHVPVPNVSEIPAHGRSELRYFDIEPPADLILPHGIFPPETLQLHRHEAEWYWGFGKARLLGNCFINVVLVTRAKARANHAYFAALRARGIGLNPHNNPKRRSLTQAIRESK